MKTLLCSLLIVSCLAWGSAAAPQKRLAGKGKVNVKIEFLYFDSCPSYQQALANLKAALKEKHLTADLVLIKVESEDQAQKVGFQGSPSIRINGKDLEGRDEGFSFSCRLYEVNGKPSTTPSQEAILAKLEHLAQ
ncbi:MAG: alkylmercury lyase [Acidobacteria bacterium]|nr:alkylmercury lyase [Acidobacteriota bacterium]